MTLEFPLLKREFVALLRTRRAFWLLIAVVSLSCLLPLFNWPHGGRMHLRGEQNLELFLTFAMTQMTVALLIIPAFTAGAISGERERNTYELLYTTLLPPWTIILSKVAAAVGYILVLLISTVPALCVLHLVGGIGFEAILASYAITFAAVLSSAMVCLTVSMRSKTTGHAVVRGVVWVLFWQGGLFLLILFSFFVGWEILDLRFDDDVIAHAVLTSPYGAMGLSVYPEPALNVLPFPAYAAYLGYAGLLIVSHFFYLLRRVQLPDVATRPKKERRRLKKAQGKTAPVRRSLFSRALLRLGGAGWMPFRNPVFLKEVQSEFFGRLWYRRTVFWVPLMVFILLVCSMDRLEEIFVSVGLTCQLLLAVILPGVAATAITREIEQGHVDFLRGTLLSFRGVLTGKFLAAIYAAWGLLAAAGWVLLIAPFSARDAKNVELMIWGYLVSVVVLPLTVLFVIALATLFSVISKRTVAALVSTYLVLLLIFLGLPLLAAIVGFWRWDKSTFGLFLQATHPIVTLVEVLDDFSGFTLARRGVRGPERTYYAIIRLGFFVLNYVVATALLWWISARLFQRLRSRDR